MSNTKRARIDDSGSHKATTSVVYVLVKTADQEGRTRDWECNADTEVIGTYRSRMLAERAKIISTQHMDTNDDLNYSSGECWITKFEIFEQTILDHVNVDDSEEEEEEEETTVAAEKDEKEEES